MGVNEGEIKVVDGSFPCEVGKFVLIALAIGVDELEIVI